MSMFRKKPVVIEAMQFETNNAPDDSHMDAITAWIGRDGRHDGTSIYVDTLEGTMTASVGDWIIRGVSGEFYPCKPDIFALTYDVVTEV